MKAKLWLLLALINFPILSATPFQFQLTYQQLIEPYATYPCHFLPTSPFDFEVFCQKHKTIKKFRLHLALNHYPQTPYGYDAYELLYWVSDTHPYTPHFSSHTTWIYHPKNNSPIHYLTSSLGIENDLAALKLELWIPQQPTASP